MPGEAEIARVVVAELQRQGYDTYEEVTTGYGGKRADIVGVNGRIYLIAECKQSLSLRLLGQLMAWRGTAHFIIGATERGGGRHGSAAEWFCRQNGFGLWMVGQSEIYERVTPRLHRTTTTQLQRCLSSEQRSGNGVAAGTNSGGYWTPFLRTSRYLQQVVKDHPGIPLKQALAAVDHHYASEKSALAALPGLLRRGVIQGVRMEEGRPLKLYPVEISRAGR